MVFSIFKSKSVFLFFLILLFVACLCKSSHGLAQDGSTRRLFGSKSRVIPNCGQLVLKSQCSQNSNCSWCTSQFIDDMCFSKSEALRLPHQVFSCAFIP